VKSVLLAFDPRSVALSRASVTERIPAFDYLRAFVIFLVVLHHAVMAYCTGGHAARGGDYTNSTAPVVDPAQWDGFNLMVMGNDGFFMPLMFLLAGLFVRPSLARKGLGRYLADRALRLGVPLLVGIVTVVPLSYYASYLQSGGTADFPAFWVRMVTAGPWPSGPLWFVGALLVFDAATALILSRDSVQLWVRRLLAALDRRPKVVWFAAFLLLSALVFLPALGAFGPSLWLTAGPFGIQASRIGLYVFFFVAGMIVGASRLAAFFVNRWQRWPLIAILATLLFFALRGVTLPTVVDGAVMLLFCVAMAVGLVALAVSCGCRRGTVGDSLGANAYGIYLLHYPIVLWIQYGLLRVPFGPVGKGLLVLMSGYGLSWLAASLLRRVPGVARIV
jgi:peptidoglycan/LPS O-acetylase OafA/YrhL